MVSVSLGLFLIVMAGVVFFSLTIPKAREIQVLRGERDALEEIVAGERATVEAATELLVQYQSIANLQENLALALPTEERIPDILNQLQGIAKASGVLIESVDLQILPIRSKNQNAVIEPVGTIEARLTARGTYESIKLYVDSIGTNIRVMDVDTLRVEGGTEGDVLTYDIVVKSYYQL